MAMEFLPHTPLTRRIDGLVSGIGRWLSYIWLVLLAVIVVNVLLRYAFNEGRIEFEELQWHL
ncbi:MAG: C4-dicarboxylate ABC transporter permease, partial [Pseudomonadota bacterium]